MASRQNGAIQTHTHTLILQRSGGGVNTAMRVVNGGNNWWPFNANGSESEFMTVESNQGVRSAGGPETRPMNTAYLPRIHA